MKRNYETEKVYSEEDLAEYKNEIVDLRKEIKDLEIEYSELEDVYNYQIQEIEELKKNSISIEALQDLFAFYQWCVANKEADEYLLSNLIHDIYGLATKEVGFSPRTKGYRKFVK